MCIWYAYIFHAKDILKCIFITTNCSSIGPHIYCYFSDMAVVISQNVLVTYIVIQMSINRCASSCKYVYSYVQFCIWTAVYIGALSSCSELRALACWSLSEWLCCCCGRTRPIPCIVTCTKTWWRTQRSWWVQMSRAYIWSREEATHTSWSRHPSSISQSETVKWQELAICSTQRAMA